MRKDVSIEYAHIYTNAEIGLEQSTAIQLLSQATQRLLKAGETYSLVVLVDDYSFPDPSFDYKSYVAWLATQGYKPDLMMRESQLIPLCDDVLGLVEDRRLRLKIVNYIKAKKYPCSLFIAAWYLLRLGVLSQPGFAPEFVASRLVNILPESFKPFEDQALQIIGATKYRELVKQVGYLYIDGRLLG